ncbi:sulfate adenylyltransferase [Aquirufa aurantiipilula]|uniref:sulfate adenylyltransferase n=1 Tax=Aquirufa aurantiipilula TaxID=2696561 RepID=UPI001CAA71B8|nr:sulfate adenylyltransferase [Aquirufa aurantiipilula]MBZ1326591.1 sulfate adenylyltransferase [Aquirufa aurantiipilula]
MNSISLTLRQDQYLELEKIGIEAFLPLDHFMTESEFISVTEKMRLPSGYPFPIPVILDVNKETAEMASNVSHIDLIYKDILVGKVYPESIYTCDKEKVAKLIYSTSEIEHPGVSRFYSQGDWFIGGKTIFLKQVKEGISSLELTPAEVKKKFAELGWNSIVGFQTRNVPHRAHEYLQKVALEHVDGLFIQPLVGQKKNGDYTPEAVMTGYRALVDGFYPTDKVVLGILSTSMRYAGPREAVFHAIIRKNYGCTHFIVGRDHAGVGNYYEKYAGHDILHIFENEIGIKIMYLHGPFYCESCDGIVTEHTCPHFKLNPEVTNQISGSMMREILSGGNKPDKKYFRPEILEALKGCELFINE